MRALLIHNTNSGQRRRGNEVAAAVSRLVSAGWDVELLASADIQELDRAARQAVANGMEALIVAGGDGTLNLVIQALAYHDTVLGVLPCGTANSWARELRIPMDLKKATDVLLNGQVARVDLGMAGDRYFLFVASVGFDAMVVRGVDKGAKRRLGKAAYIIAAFAKALELRGEEATIRVDGQLLHDRVLMVVASNLRLYGGLVQIAPEAYADDGLLDIWVFRGRGVFAAIRHAVSVLLGLQLRNAEATCFRTTSAQIDSGASLPIELDGDYFGTTPITIRVAPGALRTIVPLGPHQPLISGTQQLGSERSTGTK